MATGLVIHISSGEDRHTEILTDERVRIGSSEGCELRLRLSNLPKCSGNVVLLELVRSGASYRIEGFDSSLGLTKNGKPVEIGAEVHDGDEVRVDQSDLVLRFLP